MRKVAKKQKKQDPSSRMENKGHFSWWCLILMLKTF